MQAVNSKTNGDENAAGNGRGVMVGIDLGTTYSLVAFMRDGQPLILPNVLGSGLTPSAVGVGSDGEILVGEAARARATTHPEATALAFKRDMGMSRRYSLAGRSFSATELSALVLRSLKEDAERALGAPVVEAVITVPAYFDELARRATRDAAALAGLKVERIINEPTAAALAYGLHQRHRRLRALVLDLGGGTFDVTVLEIIEGVVEIQASAGDARLGGEDFADALAVHAIEGHPIAPTLREDARAWARIRGACERAKKALSAAEEHVVEVSELMLDGRPHSLQRTISRAEAERCWAPLVERMRSPLARVLRDAGLRPGDIDEVLLVGGATRMPCVRALAEQLFGKAPLLTLPPDEAVALGAAVQAALKAGDQSVEDMIVTDVAPFSMGIATATTAGRQEITGLFSPIIDRGTTLPASVVHRFSTTRDDQRAIDVEVYQGEHSLCRDNLNLGTLRVEGLPPGPAGTEGIDVRFTYDLSGLLEVDVTVVSTEHQRHMVIDRSEGALTSAQFEEARRRLAALKFHPRETLPNATALHRAEAAYIELVGAARETLGDALARFRSALEAQDSGAIERLRRELLALLDR
jgi:molecular chaperone HscC